MVLRTAAERLWLRSDAAWCRWRASETRARLVVRADPGYADLHIGAIWVEGGPEIPPGGRGRVRLGPFNPDNWRHLKPGEVITMHEGQPVRGIATITEVRGRR